MNPRKDTRCLALLVFLAGLFWFKFYTGGRFIFQGDVFMNLYLHGNPAALYGGWDTHMLYYPGWYPVSGAYFPSRMILHGIVAGDGDRVDILKREPNHAVLDVMMDEDGMLIASEPWFPGWSAVVDGSDAAIVRADGAFQGVWLKQGRHRVEFRFHDRITLIGVLISWGSILAAAIVAIVPYRKLKKP